jgi:hypothetical protein
MHSLSGCLLHQLILRRLYTLRLSDSLLNGGVQVGQVGYSLGLHLLNKSLRVHLTLLLGCLLLILLNDVFGRLQMSVLLRVLIEFTQHLVFLTH